MKKLVFFLFGAMISLNLLQAQHVYNGHIRITSQEEVDTFDYQEINGSLTVQESSPGSIENLDNLSELTKVTGTLSIKNNSSIENLNGLSNLKELGGDFILFQNENLASFGNFSKLSIIGGKLSITNNPSLININGFSALKTIEGSLYINLNKELTHLSGFTSLSVIGENLYINRNDNLLNIDGLSAVNINKNITITANFKLKNLDGLTSNPFIFGELIVKGNTSLQQACGIIQLLQKETAVSGITTIENNGSSTSSKIDIITNCLNSYVGDLVLTTQEEVDAFDYQAIIGSLTISETSSYSYKSITKISKLSSLVYVGGDLNILDNKTLHNIFPIGSVSSIGGILKIEGNPGLLPGTLEDVLDYFLCPNIADSIIYEQIEYQGDTKFCKGKPTVRDENRFLNRDRKQASFSNITEIKKQLVIYPTISNGNYVTLSGLETNFSYHIYTLSGALVETKAIKTDSHTEVVVFNKQLTPGVYFIRLAQKNSIQTLRFMVK